MKWESFRGLFSWKRGGIRRRLLFIGLAFLAFALITNTLAGFFYARRQIEKTAAQVQIEVASRVSHEIEKFINRKQERLLDLATFLGLHAFGSEEQRLFALLLLKNDNSFTEIAVLDDKGMEVLKVSERKIYLPREFSDQSRSEKFKRASSGESYVSSVYATDRAEPYVTMAVPIKGASKQVMGLVSAEMNLKFLWQVIGDVKFGSAGYAYLVDDLGNLIAHKDPSLVLKRTNLSHLHEVQEFLRDPMGVDPTVADIGRGIMGEPVMGTFASVRGLGWAVILEEPVDSALADLRRMRRYAFLLLGLGLLVGAVIITYVSNKITKPIRELHRGVEIIAGGNLDHRVEIKSGDEIEELAQEFNEMAGEIKTLYYTLDQKVEQRTRELAALYDVTATVNQSLEMEPVLQEVIKKITEIFHFDATRIYLFNTQMDELHLRASFETLPDSFKPPTVVPRGQGVNGRVAETGKPMIFEDAQSDPRYKELSHGKSIEKAG
ncbi:MAG: cache domain-containing protein, partial [Deltaproteobacteria bacterium]|nr:cache domain-containing protein [Deltaproteobacteria bacterium]